MQTLIDIVVDALATEIEDALDAAGETMPVFRGMDVSGEGDDRFDFVTPSITVEAGEPSTENTAGALYQKIEDEDADNVRITWRRGWITFPIQLDFYTTTKTQRHNLAPILTELFFPRDDTYNRPLPEGLRLVLSSYFDAVARIVIESQAAPDEQGRDQGFAHAVWALEASTAILEQTVHAKITRDAEVVELTGD